MTLLLTLFIMVLLPIILAIAGYTTASMFVIGVDIITLIARYNRSNTLFWTLLVAYALGFTGTKLVYDNFHEKKQSQQSLNQAYPTQGLLAMDNAFVCIDENVSYTTTETTSNPVSQANTPGYIEDCHTLSYVPGVTQGLYLHILPNPPNNSISYDTS